MSVSYCRIVSPFTYILSKVPKSAPLDLYFYIFLTLFFNFIMQHTRHSRHEMSGMYIARIAGVAINLYRRWRSTSYMNTAAATLTLSDCICPIMGSLARRSASLSSSGLIPVSSAPIISRVGFLKSTSR